MAFVCQQQMAAAMPIERRGHVSIGKVTLVWLLEGLHSENCGDQSLGGFHIGFVFCKLFLEKALFVQHLYD